MVLATAHTTRAAARSVVRSATAGRRARSFGAWKARATGLTCPAVTLAPFSGFNDRSKIDSFGLITGQVGYAFNNVLLYVKGGAAVADVKNSVTDGAGFFASNSDTRWGGTVGAGVEYGFAPGFSLGFEYDHLFLGRSTIALTPVDSSSIKNDVDLFTARLNYKFGGPVIGKY